MSGATLVLESHGVQCARRWLGLDPSMWRNKVPGWEAAIINDPDLAIGTVKELVETCCTTNVNRSSGAILNKRRFTKLVKLTCKNLDRAPDENSEKAKDK